MPHGKFSGRLLPRIIYVIRKDLAGLWLTLAEMDTRRLPRFSQGNSGVFSYTNEFPLFYFISIPLQTSIADKKIRQSLQFERPPTLTLYCNA